MSALYLELNKLVSFEFSWKTSFKDFENALNSRFPLISHSDSHVSQKPQRQFQFTVHFKYNKDPISKTNFNLEQLDNSVILCVPFNEAEKQSEDAYYYCNFQGTIKKFKFTHQILDYKLHFLIHYLFNLPLSAIKISFPNNLQFDKLQHYLMEVQPKQQVNILVSINTKTYICAQVQDWTQPTIDFNSPTTFTKNFFCAKQEAIFSSRQRALHAFYPPTFDSKPETEKEVLVLKVPKPGSTEAQHVISDLPNFDISLSFPEEQLNYYNVVFAIVHKTQKTKGCLSNRTLVLKRKQQRMSFIMHYSQISFGFVRCLFYNFFHVKSPVCFANERETQKLFQQDQYLETNGNTKLLHPTTPLTLVCFDEEEQKQLLFRQQQANPPVAVSDPNPIEFMPLRPAKKRKTPSPSPSPPSPLPKKQKTPSLPSPSPIPKTSILYLLEQPKPI